MKIYCKNCGLYLGEIKDATLRKGILYYCKDCVCQDTIKKKEDVPDFMRDLFK